MGNLVKDLATFKGKRVFVTGDTGFKGSWLGLWLSELGADISGYSLPPKHQEDHYNVIALNERIRHTDGDIRDCARLRESILDFRPEVIFHLAAQPLVRRSYREPKETFDTNVGGSVNLLEAARECESLRALVYITSDKCYKNKEWVWGYRETDELGGHDPYSASKAAAEIVFSSYRDSFFSKGGRIGTASARAGNVIGGGDWSEDRIVPDCIRALSGGKPITLRNPKATRPWQHVLEPLSGYLLLAKALLAQPDEFSGAWNFGPDGSSFKDVEALARLAIDCWGSGELIVDHDENAPHEAGLLHLNCDKSRHKLGWTPRWNFLETVQRTIGWYRATDRARASLDQIHDYMENDDD